MIQLLEIANHVAQRLVATGAPVYLSANPVEYHGPHLSLRNDALISAGFIRSIHASLAKTHPEWPLLFAGNLDAGVDPVPGPGSRFVSYADMCRLMLETCQSLAELGAKRVVIMTFHGSPLHNLAIHKGVTYLEEAGIQVIAPLNVMLRDLLEADPRELASAYAHVPDEHERELMIQGAASDIHGGFIETSLSLLFAPESVTNHAAVPPCAEIKPLTGILRIANFFRGLGRVQLADELQALAAAAPWYGLRPFPGYTGRPHHATAAAGAIVAEREVRLITECALKVFAGEMLAPRPVMTWIEKMTLGGRIGEIRIPASEIRH